MKRFLSRMSAAGVVALATVGGVMAQGTSWVPGADITAMEGDAAATATALAGTVIEVGGLALAIWGAYQVFGVIRRAFSAGKGR